MDYVGYIASFLVLLTFYMKRMIPLRIVALFSNVAFLTYGIGMHLMPVALLHCALIPINVHRLVLALRDDSIPLYPVLRWHPVRHAPMAFTSEVDAGSRKENASKQKARARL
ncbi:MAG: hypothetical protein NTAFB05_25220 [Nitrobacter sp.]|uniref:hypothetical protein n=1 Tax=Nitrobacter sp. TaxID=29420 RepID=UPI00387DE6A8